MKTNVIKTFKINRKIVCYIKKYSDNDYRFCTGKPSDRTCLSAFCKSLDQAEYEARCYLNQYYSLFDTFCF